MRPPVFLHLALSLLAPPSFSLGEATPVESGVVDTIEVVARRLHPGEDWDRLVRSIQILPAGDRSTAALDLGDLLDRAVGVQIRKYGGPGAVGLASVRGAGPGHVAIAIDDARLSVAPDGLTHLGLLPVSLVDRIEIHRGPNGRLGSTGAGLIRLRTSDTGTGHPPRVRVGVGSFGVRSLSGAWDARRGEVSILLAGGTMRSAGDYPYRDRMGTRHEPSDDRTVRRSNNALRQDDVLVRLQAPVGRYARLRTVGHGLWRDAGVPGTESLPTTRVRDRIQRWIQSVAIQSSGNPAVDWKLSAHLQRDRDRYRNPLGEGGLPIADQSADLLARGADVEVETDLASGSLRARLAGGWEDERWSPQDLLHPGAQPVRSRRTLRASSGLAGSLDRARLRWSVEAPWIGASESLGGDRVGRGSRWLPRVSADWTVRDPVRLRAGAGRFSRLPSFVELYGTGGSQVGNPNLKPEEGLSLEIGLSAGLPPRPRWKRWNGGVEATLFETRTDRAIHWLQNSRNTIRPTNVERTRTRGVESLMHVGLKAGGETANLAGPALAWTVAFTLQDARDDGPSRTYRGKRLPYLPSQQGSFESGADFGRFRLAHLIEYESKVDQDRYNSPVRRRGARVRHDLEMAVAALPRRLEATFSVRNLADQTDPDVDGFPVPGRSVHIQLTWTAASDPGSRSNLSTP